MNGIPALTAATGSRRRADGTWATSYGSTPVSWASARGSHSYPTPTSVKRSFDAAPVGDVAYFTPA
jgi:hypothetical protein